MSVCGVGTNHLAACCSPIELFVDVFVRHCVDARERVRPSSHAPFRWRRSRLLYINHSLIGRRKQIFATVNSSFAGIVNHYAHTKSNFGRKVGSCVAQLSALRVAPACALLSPPRPRAPWLSEVAASHSVPFGRRLAQLRQAVRSHAPSRLPRVAPP